jgi:MFS family permease
VREPTSPVFWGWRVLAGATVAYAFTAPGQTAGVAVFVDPIIEDLALSRTSISGAYLVGTLAGAATLPLVGRLIDRWGVRRAMLALGCAFSGTLVGMAGVAGLMTLVLGFIGIRMLGQGALPLACGTAVTLWFDRRRGSVLGLFSALGEGAISLAPVALLWTIGILGWRATWLVLATLVVAVVVPIALWAIHDSPSRVGQFPDGRTRPAERDEGMSPKSWTAPEATHTLMFWAVAGAVATTGIAGTGLGFHQISILGERGLTPEQAAAAFIPQTLAAIGSTLIVGWAVDRFSAKPILVAAMGFQALALVLVQVAAPGLRAITFAVSLGLALGAVTAQHAALPRYFGTRHIGAIRGIVMAMAVTGSALGPFVLGVGFDVLGSYGPILNGLLAAPLAIALLVLVAQAPRAVEIGEVDEEAAAGAHRYDWHEPT